MFMAQEMGQYLCRIWSKRCQLFVMKRMIRSATKTLQDDPEMLDRISLLAIDPRRFKEAVKDLSSAINQTNPVLFKKFSQSLELLRDDTPHRKRSRMSRYDKYDAIFRSIKEKEPSMSEVKQIHLFLTSCNDLMFHDDECLDTFVQMCEWLESKWGSLSEILKKVIAECLTTHDTSELYNDTSMLWNIGRYRQVSLNVRHEALYAQGKIMAKCQFLDYYWFYQYLKEMKKEENVDIHSVLVCLMTLIAFGYPTACEEDRKLFENSVKNNSLHATHCFQYRHQLLYFMETKHGASQVIVNGIGWYLRHIKSSIDMTEISIRLDLIKSILCDGLIAMKKDRMKEVWKLLVVESDDDVRNIAFMWFSSILDEIAEDELQQFFLESFIQLNPTKLTLEGLQCFRSFFYAAKKEEEGINYVWRVICESDDEVATVAESFLFHQATHGKKREFVKHVLSKQRKILLGSSLSTEKSITYFTKMSEVRKKYVIIPEDEFEYETFLYDQLIERKFSEQSCEAVVNFLRFYKEAVTIEQKERVYDYRLLQECLKQLRNETDTCSVCLEKREGPQFRILNACTHRVCYTCSQGLRSTSKCPMCRRTFDKVIEICKCDGTYFLHCT